MSILSTVKDAFLRHYKCIGAAFTLVLGLLFAMDNTRAFAVSLMGIQHAIHHPDSKGYFNDSTRESYEMYTAGWRDLITVLALNLPIWVVSTFIWDFMSKYSSGTTQFCFYFTSGLVLVSGLLVDCYALLQVLFSEQCLGFELQRGNMTYSVKMCFLVQLALLCSFLERVVFNRGYIPRMIDLWLYGLLNLLFGMLCYSFSFFPMMMIVYIPRFFVQASLIFVEGLAMRQHSDSCLIITQIYIHLVRLVMLGEVVLYGVLIISTVTYGFINATFLMNTSMFFVLLAMLLVSGQHVMNSKKFDLDIFRAGVVNEDVNFAAAVSGNQPALLIVPAPGQLLALPPGPTIENTK